MLILKSSSSIFSLMNLFTCNQAYVLKTTCDEFLIYIFLKTTCDEFSVCVLGGGGKPNDYSPTTRTTGVLILLYISEKDGKRSLLHNVSLPL